MIISNKTYDTLKNVSLIVLPALGTFYATLSQIWGLPYGEQIVGTFAAAGLCLGAILKISTKRYNAEKDANDGK